MDPLNALTTAARNAASPDDAQIRESDLRQAAQQFEAIFLRNLMKEMRKVNELFDSKDNPLNSDATRLMQGFYDDKLCDQIAAHSGIGIAEMIVKQLSPKGDK